MYSFTYIVNFVNFKIRPLYFTQLILNKYSINTQKNIFAYIIMNNNVKKIADIKHPCPCGWFYTIHNHKRHNMSKHHVEYLKNNKSPSDVIKEVLDERLNKIEDIVKELSQQCKNNSKINSEDIERKQI